LNQSGSTTLQFWQLQIAKFVWSGTVAILIAIASHTGILGENDVPILIETFVVRREFLNRINSVTIDELKSVGSRYIAPLFQGE
jgi:hypothetical protein